ncbi:MerR family transcriptional regulator [Nocardia sp. XZ_19_369]|uniref:MerR family transcriptional regulator n=1 Tax=Nocardia sp. XZ_19_369 TaxID=2769487 RepID=UPI00188F8DEA|nr:MerR family transcriptional regulator [Nocardia sp. XZ_19_369]
MDDEQSGHLQIGEVALRTELSVRTVRHYHDVGLVTPSERSAGGFRLYTEADIQRLLVIRRMKPLGFTLAEMKDLLESLDTIENSSATAQQRRHALDILDQCRVKAEESSATLRRNLAYAEELTELLTTRSAQTASTTTR